MRAVKTEFAEWDSANGQWHAPKRATSTHFRTDGSISESEGHNPDGSVTKSQYLYDDAEQLLEVRFQWNDGPISISRHFYDDFGRPIRKTFLQGDGTERDSEIWTYDQNGRKTKIQFVSEIQSGACGTFYGVEGAQGGYGAANVAEIMTVFDERDRPSEALFYDSDRSVVMRVVLGRDSAGRLIREESRTGDKSPFAEIVANTSPEEHYKYDGKGNWIEKVVSARYGGSLDFQPSNIERREIRYWTDEE